MKKAFSFIVIAACLLLVGCTTPSSVPAAIRQLISQQSNMIDRVDECQYHGQVVYFFCGRTDIADNCDYLYSSGGVLMAVFGGITGYGDGRCPDFFENATVIRCIWAQGTYLE